MALKFSCENCGKDIIVKFLKVGEMAKCKRCFAEVKVPPDATEIDTPKQPKYTPPTSPVKEEKTTKKHMVRAFGTLLGLSFITLGFYLFHWCYVNLKEIEHSFTFNTTETTIKTARTLLVVFVIVAIVITIISIITFFLILSQPRERPPLLTLLALTNTIVGAVFFYYYTASVALGQRKAQLTAFKIPTIYSSCLIGEIILFMANFIPSITLPGAIFFVYLYQIQQQTNKLWLEGNFDKV